MGQMEQESGWYQFCRHMWGLGTRCSGCTVYNMYISTHCKHTVSPITWYIQNRVLMGFIKLLQLKTRPQDIFTLKLPESMRGLQSTA